MTFFKLVEYPKYITKVSELALEITLFYYDLRDVKKLPKGKLEDLRDFLTGTAITFGHDFYLRHNMLNTLINDISRCA